MKYLLLVFILIAVLVTAGCTNENKNIVATRAQMTQVPTSAMPVTPANTDGIVDVWGKEPASVPRDPNVNPIVGTWTAPNFTFKINADGFFRSTGSIIGNTPLDSGSWINDGKVCSLYYEYVDPKSSAGVGWSVSSKCKYNPYDDTLTITPSFPRNSQRPEFLNWTAVLHRVN